MTEDNTRKHTSRDSRCADGWLDMTLDEIANVLGNASPSVFVGVLTVDGIVAYAHSAVHDVAGMTLNEVIGKPIDAMSWFSPSDSVRAELHGALRSAAAGTPASLVFSFESADGCMHAVDFALQPVHAGDGKVACIVATAQDSTERRQVGRVLALTHFALNRARLALFQVGADGRIRDANDAAGKLVGYQREALRGLPVHVLSRHVTRTGWQQVWTALKARGSLQYESTYVDADGYEVPVEVVVSHITYDDEEYGFAFVTDISERKRAEERIHFLVHYDTLTRLPNRASFLQIVEGCLMQAEREGETAAVMIVDIERFWVINDTLGRAVADELLWNVAERLRSQGEVQGRLARFGADQFGLIITGATDEEDVEQRAGKIIGACFDHPFVVGDRELQASAKWGIAMFPKDGVQGETLLRNAETALMEAKQASEKYLFYTHRLSRGRTDRLRLELRLWQALERDEFVLHYQPKVDLITQRIVGVEALLRWVDPAEGLVPPARFIPLLEETGMIKEVGAWVLRRARQDYRSWQNEGVSAPRIAVNVSAFQLRQRDFVDTVRRELMHGDGQAGVDLEITETILMEDIERNIAKLEAIRRMGVEIAIDDFGTGYSSLAYLTKLPAQTLKIDCSFIERMLEDADTKALVSAIISLAHTLRLRVVAEGVETQAQADALRALNCDEMQGFLYSKPLTSAALLNLLKKN